MIELEKNFIGDKLIVQELVKNLTQSQQLDLLSTLYGFSKMPPSINDVIEDDFYLGKYLGKGKLYPYWKEHLNQIFPDPIRCPYFILSFGGALGIGKSVNSMLCAIYTIVKMAHLEDAYETFGLERDVTPFTIRCFNLTKDRANAILVNPIMERLKGSPFFVEYMRDNNNKLPYNLRIESGKKANDIISECCLYSLISETNFFKPEHARDIITTSISRMSSRLQKVKGVFGTIVLDSSTTDKNSVVEEFLTQGVYTDDTKVVRASIWDVKPQEYFANGGFHIYAGSSEIMPHIIEENEDISRLDKDRIIFAPNELYKNFKHDIEKTLIDQAGICLDSFSDFFSDKNRLLNCFVNDHQDNHDVVAVDFYDDEQIYDVVGKQCHKVLPKDKYLYVRIDLGITDDLCGFAIACIEEEDYRLIDGVRVFNPKISVPIAFSIGRFENQQTSIHKIENFLIWLNKHFCVKIVSTDQYQSTGIRQTMSENKIENKLLSVDRTDAPYIKFKNLVNLGNVTLPNNRLLKQELTYLQRIGNKIDHLDCYSKDCSDAVCGAIYTVIEDGIEAVKTPKKKMIEEYNKMLGGNYTQVRKLKIVR